MKDVPFVLQSERQIYAEYDRDRRLRISRIIAPAFAAILTTVAVASLIVPQQFQGTRGNLGTVALCDALFLLGAFAAWRRWVNLATGSILAAALLLMALAILVNQPFILSDLFTVPAVVIIGLSALIGLPWMILVTTAWAGAAALPALRPSPARPGFHGGRQRAGALPLPRVGRGDGRAHLGGEQRRRRPGVHLLPAAAAAPAAISPRGDDTASPFGTGVTSASARPRARG